MSTLFAPSKLTTFPNRDPSPYILNGHIKSEFVADDFHHLVTKLSTEEFLEDSNVIEDTKRVAATIMHVTFTKTPLEGLCDIEDLVDVFMLVCACIAVKMIIETDTPFTFACKALRFTKFTPKEMACVESTILQATNWLKEIR